MTRLLDCNNRNSCEFEQTGTRRSRSLRSGKSRRARKERGFIMSVALLLPKTDTGLLQWSQNVVNLITPVPATWGLVVGDVTSYTALHTAYSTALAAADPSVRSKPATVTKNTARANLKNGAAI